MAEAAERHIISVKRILMPIDRSEYNNKIIEYAISLSKAWDAKITAIHVLDAGLEVWDGKDKETKPEKIQEKIYAEALLNEIDITAKKEGINIEKEVLEKNDKVGKMIIEYAKKNKMDVIVIGTKGMSAVEEYFFGSVVKEVFQYAHCPVFAIR
jgi:nucleotide-binding universal stress UspA family protein